MNKDDYQLVWEDNFDYEGTPNPLKWNYDLGNRQWANAELQSYTNRPENVFVKNNKLHIRAIKEKDGEREYTSTRMTTYQRQSFQYGYFEFRVKLPKGKGSWPAVWMLPDSIKEGLTWPLCGEIDIIEHIGRKENNLFFSLHSMKHNHTRNDTKHYTVFYDYPGVTEDFNDYAMEWTPDYTEFYINGTSVCRFNKNDDEEVSFEAWPFDKPFYLIFNIAVGGNLGGEVDESSMPFIMEVDYVRVYQKKAQSN